MDYLRFSYIFFLLALSPSFAFASGQHVSISLSNGSGRSMSISYTCSSGIAEKSDFTKSKTVTLDSGRSQVIVADGCATEYMAIKINYDKVLNNSIYGVKSGSSGVLEVFHDRLKPIDPSFKDPLEGFAYIRQVKALDSATPSGAAR